MNNQHCVCCCLYIHLLILTWCKVQLLTLLFFLESCTVYSMFEHHKTIWDDKAACVHGLSSLTFPPDNTLQAIRDSVSCPRILQQVGCTGLGSNSWTSNPLMTTLPLSHSRPKTHAAFVTGNNYYIGDFFITLDIITLVGVMGHTLFTLMDNFKSLLLSPLYVFGLWRKPDYLEKTLTHSLQIWLAIEWNQTHNCLTVMQQHKPLHCCVALRPLVFDSSCDIPILYCTTT